MSNQVIKGVKHLNKVIVRALYDASRRACKKSLSYNLDFPFLRDLFFKQKGLCYYTNQPFTLKGSRSLSIDRVDNSKGYTKGNVVWCWFSINAMKANMVYSEAKDLCTAFLMHNPDWSLLERV